MPSNLTGTNQAFLDIGLSSKGGGETIGQRQCAHVLPIVQSLGAPPSPTNVTTQYQVRTNSNTSVYVNASPTFNGTIPPTATINKILFVVDGSSYNRATNTGSLFFNWGLDLTTSGGNLRRILVRQRLLGQPVLCPIRQIARISITEPPAFALGKDISALYGRLDQRRPSTQTDGLVGDSAFAPATHPECRCHHWCQHRPDRSRHPRANLVARSDRGWCALAYSPTPRLIGIFI